MISTVKVRLIQLSLFFVISVLDNTVGANDDVFSMKKAAAFFESHCLECHHSDAAEGDIDLEKLSSNFGNDATANVWKQVLEAVAFGEMPPQDEPRPKIGDKKKIVAWIDSELAKSGHPTDLQSKMLLPDYGNYVDHKTLFDGSITSAPFTP